MVFLAFFIPCNSFVFAIVKIYLLHRLTESKKSPRHKKPFLRHKNLCSYMSAFRDRGVPGPTSENVAACPSPDGSARGRARRGDEGVREVEIPWPSCSSRAQVGCACSRGLQVFHAGGSERPHASASPILFPTRANPL
jgi:hypothetical protein